MHYEINNYRGFVPSLTLLLPSTDWKISYSSLFPSRLLLLSLLIAQKPQPLLGSGGAMLGGSVTGSGDSVAPLVGSVGGSVTGSGASVTLLGGSAVAVIVEA